MSQDQNDRVADRFRNGATIAWGNDYIDLMDPDNIEVQLEDYAYCLAYTVRWRGQTRTADGGRPFYGVAEHCVRGAEMLLVEGHGHANALAFLFHESDEIPFGDFPGPAKRLPEVSATCALAKRIGASIDRNFGISVPDADLIKRFDIRMLVTERRDLKVCRSSQKDDRHHHDEPIDGYEPFDQPIIPYSHPELAAQRFIQLARILGDL